MTGLTAAERAELREGCAYGVYRHGRGEPCGRPASALRIEARGPYPVCGYHAAVNGMVSLSSYADALEAAQQRTADLIAAVDAWWHQWVLDPGPYMSLMTTLAPFRARPTIRTGDSTTRISCGMCDSHVDVTPGEPMSVLHGWQFDGDQWTCPREKRLIIPTGDSIIHTDLAERTP